jgi:Arc/MetJ-type ribon-helix-helix transcriptional regulator
MVYCERRMRMYKDDVNTKRMSISLPPELERAVTDLRKTDRFCRCSYAEIIRQLMQAGIDAVSTGQQTQTGR